jgi:hypothetical protein
MQITAVQEVQIPVLSAMLLGGCASKLIQTIRLGSMDAGLGPTALFPLRLRRSVAMLMCAIELGLGVGLIVTAGNVGRGEVADALRLGTGVFFLVGLCALLELRFSRPNVGCGCFGDFSTAPISGRTLARSVLLAAAALITIGLPPLRLHQPGTGASLLLAIFAAELVVVGALSPELGEGLVRLGYSEPCELRTLAVARTLTALRKSAQWHRHAGMITADDPADVWREMCWRYVVFPSRYADRPAEIVFAVYLRQRRPAVLSALVDATTAEVLPWPALPARPDWSSRLARLGYRFLPVSSRNRRSSKSRAESGGLSPQEAPEVRHGERDEAALGAVDQALLDQAVPSRRDA